MKIEICKWYNNADSPVLFFIDDFANVWVDTNGSGKVDLGEDWGYAKNSENSSFKYLNDMILKEFPYVKTTFFVPVGVRVGMIKNPKIKSISKMINCDQETKKFFKSINDSPKYEIAYHGTTHGKVGKTNVDFKQEWELFNSIEEAIKKINEGKEVYKDVFGYYPKGGKYCGYASNKFSDESIDSTGFLWWSRYCNLDTENAIKEGYYTKWIYGSDKYKLTNFDIKTFGNNKVVDIPSTLDGGLFKTTLKPNLKTIKGIVKFILRNYFIKNKLKKVDYLIKNKLVISIQEHISPARNDGKIQNPNIFHDRYSLIYIFNYLKGKNVWYCTGTELASYYINRSKIKIKENDAYGFSLEYDSDEIFERVRLTIKISNDIKAIKLPNEKLVYIQDRIFNIPILRGKYRFIRS